MPIVENMISKLLLTKFKINELSELILKSQQNVIGNCEEEKKIILDRFETYVEAILRKDFVSF